VKRWGSRVLLFLLLGAIVNIAVAWGCVMSAPDVSVVRTGSVDDRTAEHLLADWGGTLTEDALAHGSTWKVPGLTRIWVRAGSSFSWPRDATLSVEEDGPGWLGEASFALAEECFIYRAGWPLCSLAGAEHRPPRPDLAGDAQTRLVGLWKPRRRIVDWWRSDAAGLPVRPIWPGLVVNTLFYAAILWLLIAGPFMLRRVIRLKRGRCPRCGYDLRGSPPEVGAGGGCPECGWNRQPEATA
jgi:hypothetical protein